MLYLANGLWHLQECCTGSCAVYGKVDRNKLTSVFIILKWKQGFITAVSKIARIGQLHLHESLKAVKLLPKCLRSMIKIFFTCNETRHLHAFHLWFKTWHFILCYYVCIITHINRSWMLRIFAVQRNNFRE